MRGRWSHCCLGLPSRIRLRNIQMSFGVRPSGSPSAQFLCSAVRCGPSCPRARAESKANARPRGDQLTLGEVMETAEELDLWRLCRELTVTQAALLVAGYDPGGRYGACESWPLGERPKGYEAIKTALQQAVRTGHLRAQIVITDSVCGGQQQRRLPEGYLPDGEPDWELTTIDAAGLQSWLERRGVTTGFFFSRITPAYLDASHPRYSPKLAATVRAWQAVEDPQGKSAKQALMEYLRANGARYGLIDADGRLNEQGIEECAKVANWQTAGGAPRTPSK